MLLVSDASRCSLGTTNEVSALIEDLQYTLGEGPCVDAYRRRVPILEPDLAADWTRWLAFSPPALEAGVRAVFGFPLQIGAARLGALNLYRDQPGPLTDDQHADALVLTSVATRAILALQAGARPGELADELDLEGEFHLVVHQASGMVAAQLDVSLSDALVRLRARAFATGRSVAEIARDVVERRARFEE